MTIKQTVLVPNNHRRWKKRKDFFFFLEQVSIDLSLSTDHNHLQCLTQTGHLLQGHADWNLNLSLLVRAFSTTTHSNKKNKKTKKIISQKTNTVKNNPLNFPSNVNKTETEPINSKWICSILFVPSLLLTEQESGVGYEIIQEPVSCCAAVQSSWSRLIQASAPTRKPLTNQELPNN